MRRRRLLSDYRSPKRTRGGLTLLEMLLASGLAVLLLAGIYGALDQSARLSTQGRLEMERAQLARALVRRIEIDVRATMFNPDTAVSDGTAAASTVTTNDSTTGTGTGTGTGSTGTGSTGSTTTTETTTAGAAEDEQWTGSLGIRGSSTELWIDLAFARRQLEFSSASPTTGSSDMQTVAYFLSNPQAVEETQQSGGLMRYDDNGVGLARSQGERSVLRTLNASGGTILPGPTQILAPEVESLAFRYFDGLAWYDQWDSASSGALPRAIEVTLSFDPPPKSSRSIVTSEVSAATRTVRMVIAVPVSDAMPPEEI